MKDDNEQILTSMILTRRQLTTMLSILNSANIPEVPNAGILYLYSDTIGAQLRKCRLDKNLKVKYISEQTNYSLAAITRIEKGSLHIDKIEKLAKWVKALGYDGVQIVWNGSSSE